MGETLPPLGTTAFETDVMRGFTLDGEILVIENLNKMRAISRAVLESINQAIAIAEKTSKRWCFGRPKRRFPWARI